MLHGIGEGAPEPLGVTPIGDGLNVALFSAHAEAVDFCWFDGAREAGRVRLPERSGDVFHGHVAGLGLGTRYGFRVHGPYAPEAGHRFDPAKLLVDPYARMLDRPFVLDPAMRAFGADTAAVTPKAVVCGPEEAAVRPARTPWRDTLIYELHVRGFTMRHPAVPEAQRGTFAGLAHPAVIAHLQRLGVTAVELLPVAAWIDERHLGPLGLTNYWGYNPAAFLAPDPRLAPGGWAEIRAAVLALEAAGIETILDVVFNHSGEGDAPGPTVSLRGIDNASYYRLDPGRPDVYGNDSGCGNTLALDRAPVVRLVMDALRLWARAGGVHGFRFDLATCLGRRPDGFDAQAPLLAAIEQDPELRQLKLIAEPWDVGPGGYQLGRFGGAWGEWNDRFRDDVRRFWRGDATGLGPLATRLAGSDDAFREKRRPSRSVNFVTAHDGFTLADLVSYAGKHNAANGEDNRDGTDQNFSWNHGVEGPSDDARIRAARMADQRALIATLLLARGTPMLSMGSELGQSQAGNNNAYAQDNAASWIDWDRADADLIDFVAAAAAARRAHPLLHADRFLGTTLASGDADVRWLAPEGHVLGPVDWAEPTPDSLTMVLAGDDRRVAVICHRGAMPRRFVLPDAQGGRGWRVELDSSGTLPAHRLPGAALDVPARAVVLVVETA